MPAPKKRCKKSTGISRNFGRPYIDRMLVLVTSAEATPTYLEVFRFSILIFPSAKSGRGKGGESAIESILGLIDA